MRAASAKAASFLAASLCSDIIFVKFTNCKMKQSFSQITISGKYATIQGFIILPGSYRIHGEGYCHRTVSLCPMVHLLLQPRRSTMGNGWNIIN